MSIKVLFKSERELLKTVATFSKWYDVFSSKIARVCEYTQGTYNLRTISPDINISEAYDYFISGGSCEIIDLRQIDFVKYVMIPHIDKPHEKYLVYTYSELKEELRKIKL